MLPSAPRILIVRLTAIGDVMHGLPVATALRRALPDAHLAWLVEGRTAELLHGHPALDDVIAVPRRWLKSPSAVLTLRRRLKAAKFDVAVDLQSLLKSAVAARLSGAKLRIGFGGNEARELSGWLNNRRVRATAAHVVDRNLELLAALGIPAPEATFELAAPADAAARAAAMLDDARLRASLALINPGAGWPSKLWAPERFAAVARHLFDRYALPSFVVWAGNAERAAAETIVRNSAGAATLAPHTSLVELAALARRARLMVASDTGPLHLAAAVGTPCVGLFGPLPATRNGPYGAGHVVVEPQPRPDVPWHERKTIAGPMQAISIEQACAACDTLLTASSRRRSA